jgi:hypothetical protein
MKSTEGRTVSSNTSGNSEKYSVVSGKKIKLDLKKSKKDKEMDKARTTYLQWLNASYD